MAGFKLFAFRVTSGDYLSPEWSLGTQKMINKRLSSVNALEGESGWSAQTVELSAFRLANRGKTRDP
jgi:hypothetical protein